MKPRFVLLYLVIMLIWAGMLMPATHAEADDHIVYIVTEGDTLFGIAARLLGDGNRYPEIIALTNAQNAQDSSYALITDATLIQVGDKLAIPTGAVIIPALPVSPKVTMPSVIADMIPVGARPKGLLKSVAKVDEYTVKFTFYAYPCALLAQLATPPFSVASPTAIQTWGRDYLYHPVGTGPFVLREWVLGERLTLDANRAYWGEQPKLDRWVYRVIDDPELRFAEVLTGTVDVAYVANFNELPTLRLAPDLMTYRIPPLNVGYIAINQDWRDANGNKVFKDVRVRQAIAHAINKEGIVRSLYPQTGLVAEQFISPATLGYNKDVPDYNYSPERARELLREAGYPNGFKANLWVMPVSRSYFPDPPKIAAAIQADLRAVGIEVELVTYDWDVYLEKVDAGEHALCMLGWIPDLPDPDDTLFPLFGDAPAPGRKGPSKQWAEAGPPDARVLDLLRQARAATDPVRRSQLYCEVSAVLHGVVPGVPIMHNGGLIVARPGIAGFVPAPLYDHWGTASYVTGTLTIARGMDVVGLDVADETDADSFLVGAQIYEGLVAYDPGTMSIRPALAERWEVSADGLEWTFYLRHGVKFHDGTDFNVDAVLFNIARVWDPQHPHRAGHTQEFSYFAWFLGGFRGETTR